jgi:hypothetical protein
MMKQQFLRDKLVNYLAYIPPGYTVDDFHQLFSIQQAVGDNVFQKWIQTPGTLQDKDNIYFFPPIAEVSEKNIVKEIDDKDIRLAENVSANSVKCKNCGSDNTKSAESQIRGGDEGQSVIVVCNGCGERYREA